MISNDGKIDADIVNKNCPNSTGKENNGNGKVDGKEKKEPRKMWLDQIEEYGRKRRISIEEMKELASNK